MKEAAIYSLGLPPEFSKLVTDSNYYTERASYEMSRTMYNLMSEGFTFVQREASDYDSVRTQCAAFESDFETWSLSVEEALASDLPVPLPPSLPIPLPGPDGTIELLVRLVVICIRVLCKVFGRDSSADIAKAFLVDVGGQKVPLLKLIGLRDAAGGTYESYLSLIAKGLMIGEEGEEIPILKLSGLEDAVGGGYTSILKSLSKGLVLNIGGVDTPLLQLIGLQESSGGYTSLLSLLGQVPIRISLETAHEVNDVSYDID
jgi:hypothetical protein